MPPASTSWRCFGVAGEPPISLFKGRIAAGAADAIAHVLASGQLATGPRVHEFETRLGERIGNPHCVATSDRAGALTLALRLCGVTPGDEVLLSPLTCLSTTMPIANLQARPVWCDIDPNTGMLDPQALKNQRSRRAKAIIHYHWAGDVGPLAALQAAANLLDLPLIEEASGAFAASFRGRALGATGSDFCVYSFYAVSHLAAGEGGALFCGAAASAQSARQLRRFNIHQASFRLPGGDLNPDSDIQQPGYSCAMSDLTAGLALAQLREVDDTLARHRANAAWLDAALANVPGITRLQRDPEAQSAHWVYALRASGRASLINKLHRHGIAAQRLHLRNDRYSCFADPGQPLPGVEAFDADNLCIPCGWWLSPEDLTRIARCIAAGW